MRSLVFLVALAVPIWVLCTCSELASLTGPKENGINLP